MIPIKLQIKNFLSYGAETQIIDFQPYNLICLSGKNGHGKSALLDAMTWVIWGEARKVSGQSKPDQGLLRLGQRQMMVTLDFEFNKSKYRIRREFTNAYGKAYAYLEFGMFENEDKLIPLTDKTIRATQEKIEVMLGLNYDSFANSAFLRQGNSNEFSKKSPKERKEILARILGLDKYETLRKVALDKIRQSTIEKDTTVKLSEHIIKDLSSFDETKANLLKIKQEIEKLYETEAVYLKDKDNLELEKNNFSQKVQEYKLLDFQLTKMKEERSQKTQQLSDLYYEWKITHRKKIAFVSHKELENKKLELSKLIEDYQKKLEKKLEFKEEFLKYKEQEQHLIKKLFDQYNQQIQEKKLCVERLKTIKKNQEEKIKQNDNEKNQLVNELNKFDLEVGTLSTTIQKIDTNLLSKAEKQLEKRKNFFQSLVTRGNLTKVELNSLERRKILTFDEKNPSCPLCEQNLSLSRKKFLSKQFSRQERFYNHKFSRISCLIVNLKEILLKQHEEIKSQKQTIEKNNLIQIKIEEIKKVIENVQQKIGQKNLLEKETVIAITDLQKEIDILIRTIDELNNQEKNFIQEDADYKNLKIIMDSIENKLNEIEGIYNQDIHRKSILELEKIDSILSLESSSSEIAILQDQRKIEVAKLCLFLKNLKKEISNLENKITEFRIIFEQEKNLQDNEHKILSSIKEVSDKKEKLLHEKGSLENQVNKLEQLSEHHKGQKKVISQLEESIEEYKIISVALSKDGIQALLIEEAIPEIENETNDLLSKLTDNQAQIFIESLRDLKKGGTKETLDIKISDGTGIRPYEMFSGGEAFRIDFALRIAISKLLARRAGTSLQTLIIDEGFGSQDEEGLALIMDSIYKIQNDFAKVIIVSHLATMKDQFPVHFFVEKSPSGSKIRVIEQG